MDIKEKIGLSNKLKSEGYWKTIRYLKRKNFIPDLKSNAEDALGCTGLACIVLIASPFFIASGIINEAYDDLKYLFSDKKKRRQIKRQKG